MKVILKRRNSNINAVGEYNPETNELTVLSGSVVSETIRQTEKFRGAKSIFKSRANVVADGRTVVDVHFKSASTAANFVTGSSTNGLTAWKTEDGKTIKEYLSQASR